MRSTRDVRNRQLAEELRLAVGHLVRSTRTQADELTRSHAETLAQLERQDGQTIARLAADRGVRHQAMSRTIGELERLQLVGREQDKADARAFLIRITARGRTALERDRGARRDLLAQAIAGLDEEDKELLAAVPALLRKLVP